MSPPYLVVHNISHLQHAVAAAGAERTSWWREISHPVSSHSVYLQSGVWQLFSEDHFMKNKSTLIELLTLPGLLHHAAFFNLLWLLSNVTVETRSDEVVCASREVFVYLLQTAENEDLVCHILLKGSHWCASDSNDGPIRWTITSINVGRHIIVDSRHAAKRFQCPSSERELLKLPDAVSDCYLALTRSTIFMAKHLFASLGSI